MIQVVPAIIPTIFAELSGQVEKILGLAPLVQVDVLDGKFAPVTTWPYKDGAEIFEAFVAGVRTLPHADTLRYEADLMIKDPEDSLDSWLKAGFTSLIIHVESTRNLGRVIERVRAARRGLGLALKPSTPLSEVEPWLSVVDFLQCMGSDTIGYHGVALDPQVLEKLTDLHARYPELILAVDIGVSRETAPKLVEAGATKLVTGSALFQSDDIPGAIKYFSQLG
jgi:ribulose-phosphate 3-epimerase